MTTARTSIGRLAARLSIEDSSVKIADSTASATLVYLGSLANLKTKASSFTVGSAPPTDHDLALLDFSGAPMEVTSVELTGSAGGTGRLSVGLTAPSYESSSGGGSTTNNVDWQLEWTLVERPLELHPTFSPLFTPGSGDYLAESIEKWKNLGPEHAAYKAAFKIPDDMENPTVWAGLPSLAAKYCSKLLKGISAYQVQVPVVRKTEYKTSGPTTASSAGQRQSPPRFSSIAQAWLKTADSWGKTGLSRWEHRQEWTGFDSLDPDLYPL